MDLHLIHKAAEICPSCVKVVHKCVKLIIPIEPWWLLHTYSQLHPLIANTGGSVSWGLLRVRVRVRIRLWLTLILRLEPQQCFLAVLSKLCIMWHRKNYLGLYMYCRYQNCSTFTQSACLFESLVGPLKFKFVCSCMWLSCIEECQYMWSVQEVCNIQKWYITDLTGIWTAWTQSNFMMAVPI